MVVVRIWRTEIDVRRADEYREFAHSRSLPMFRAQPGFAGVLFAGQGSERVVITLWRDVAAAEALVRSEAYNATVAEIQATGFLRGDSSVEVLELEGGFLSGEAAIGCGRSSSPSVPEAGRAAQA
jgi:heme-degrading monooxygenase HmoA